MTKKTDTAAHGYSGKPLYQKLGMKAGMRCLAMNRPDHYADLIAGAEGVDFIEAPGPADMVHLFCPTRTVLDEQAQSALSYIAPKGMLWVSWPKKSSKLFVDLTEDGVRDVLLPNKFQDEEWVDVKVCAVDQDWSALKFLRRKK